MDILNCIRAQVSAIRLPLVAVTLTALPRAQTPVLLMLHWHGFRRDADEPQLPATQMPVPGSALQLNAAWSSLQTVETAMLDAAWQLGAWDLLRETRRGCATIGAPDREALECRQAFGDDPLRPDRDDHLVAEAPDRLAMRDLGARIGYLRWMFRPVAGGLWQSSSEDDTLNAAGGREPPCPVVAGDVSSGRSGQARFRFGAVRRLILP